MNEITCFPVKDPLMLTLCLEEDSILLSKAVLETLESPRQVQILINDERQMLLLQSCSMADREAVVIPQHPLAQFEISGHSLLRRIRRITGWTDSHPRVIYGTHYPQHKAIVFDLHMARPAQLQMPLEGSPGMTS